MRGGERGVARSKCGLGRQSTGHDRGLMSKVETKLRRSRNCGQ